MAADTTSTRTRAVTFSDAMWLASAAFLMAWRLAVALLQGWLFGGATVSLTAMSPRKDSAATEKSATLSVTTAEVTVTMHMMQRHVTAK